jgi:DNA-binding protein H-NS
MATKKSGSTLDALNAQIAALQAKADALHKKEVAQAVASVKETIARYGLTAADLGLSPTARKTTKAPKSSGSKPATKRQKKAGQKRAARAVKFRDDQGNTWGGMGKRPAWFNAALAAGKTPEDLLAKG